MGIVIIHYQGGPEDGNTNRHADKIPRTWTVGEIAPGQTEQPPAGGRYVVMTAKTVGDTEEVVARWAPD